MAPVTAAISGGRFGSYRFIERVDRAGPAELYHALWGDAPGADQRVCLLKRLRPELASSPVFVRMFEDEARITTLLSHPNVVRVYEQGVLEGLPYMAIEPLDGLHLSQLLTGLKASGRKLPIEVACYIAQGVAAALAHAHQAADASGEPLGILHRDVRPQNVMLLSAGGIKLIDFGVAKIHSFVSTSLNVSGAGRGKPSYVSPEQLQGLTLDGRSDLFSLGVMLWELLVGRPLFPPAEPGEAAERVLRAPLDRPASLRPEVPAALDLLVMHLIERELPRRYPRAASLVRDLEAFIPAPKDAGRAVASMVRGGLDASALLLSAIPGQAGGRPVTQVAPNLAALLSRRGMKELAIRLPGSLRMVTSVVPVVARKLRRLTRGSAAALPAVSLRALRLAAVWGWLRGQLSSRRRRFVAQAVAVAAVAFVGGVFWHDTGEQPLPAMMAPPQQAPGAAPALVARTSVVVIERLPARAEPAVTPVVVAGTPETSARPAPKRLATRAGKRRR